MAGVDPGFVHDLAAQGVSPGTISLVCDLSERRVQAILDSAPADADAPPAGDMSTVAGADAPLAGGMSTVADTDAPPQARAKRDARRDPGLTRQGIARAAGNEAAPEYPECRPDADTRGTRGASGGTATEVVTAGRDRQPADATSDTEVAARERRGQFLHRPMRGLPNKGVAPRTCQWIEGDPAIDTAMCGAASVQGKPYCAAHAARAYLVARSSAGEGAGTHDDAL